MARRALLIALGPLAVLALVVVLAGGFFSIFGRAGVFSEVPAALAGTADIPPEYLALYARAGAEHGLDWAVLAAIGSIESDHGRSRAPGVRSGQNTHGCCAGPMQFFTNRAMAGGRTTWDAYGVDGNGDGRIDVYDPGDAIPAAALYLRASGAPGDYERALFAYNRAHWYVADVLQLAGAYRSLARGWGVPGAGGDETAGLEGVHPLVVRLYLELVAATPGRQYVMSGLRPGALTTKGSLSLHASGLAVDVGSREAVSPGTTAVIAPDLDALAVLARRALGHPPIVVGTTSDACGEVLWRTWRGGNHWHHVHVGVEPACLPVFERRLALAA